MSSDIAQIIDLTAVIAAGIDGVKAVAASGQGFYDDPLRPGQKVASADTNPVAEFTHWTELPNAPAVMWLTQNKTVELTWNIPMRLWLPKNEAVTRKVALPFYDRYLKAFITNNTLSGLVARSEIKRFYIGGDKDWSWMDVGLEAVEYVNYGS